TAVAQNGPPLVPTAPRARANQRTIHSRFSARMPRRSKTAPAIMPPTGTRAPPSPRPHRPSKRADSQPPPTPPTPTARVGARGELEHALEVVVHPEEEEVLKVTDGRVAEGQEQDATIAHQRPPRNDRRLRAEVHRPVALDPVAFGRVDAAVLVRRVAGIKGPD